MGRPLSPHLGSCTPAPLCSPVRRAGWEFRDTRLRGDFSCPHAVTEAWGWPGSEAPVMRSLVLGGGKGVPGVQQAWAVLEATGICQSWGAVGVTHEGLGVGAFWGGVWGVFHAVPTPPLSCRAACNEKRGTCTPSAVACWGGLTGLTGPPRRVGGRAPSTPLRTGGALVLLHGSVLGSPRGTGHHSSAWLRPR